MSAPIVVAVVAAAYAIGTFPSALLVGRRFGFDPTAAGSGNPGASNTTRIGGRRAGALVLVGDLGKGAAAAGVGVWLDGRTLGWLAGAAAVAGHMWPATREFRGGKGVATAAGVSLVCVPVVMAGLGIVFALAVWLSGRAAVGSILTACLTPVVMAVLGRPGIEVAVAAAVAAAIVVRHRPNIDEIRQDGSIRKPA